MSSPPDDKLRDRLPGALTTRRFSKNGMDRFIDAIEWIAAFFVGIVALTAFELLVAFLQAYVFAILTCVYLNDALHPGH